MGHRKEIRYLRFCLLQAFSLGICQARLAGGLTLDKPDTKGMLGSFLKVDGVVERSSRCQHLSFFLLKKLLILPVWFWQGLQLYSPFCLPFNPSHIRCFFVISHSFIPLKQVRHRFILYVSVALRFFKNPSRWVRNIHNRVFAMPPPKRDDQMIFSCVCNLAGYHARVTVGTYFQ